MKLLLYLSHCKCAFIAVLAEAIRLCLGEADRGVSGLFVWGKVLREGVCPQNDFTKVFSQSFKALFLIPVYLPLNPLSCHLPIPSFSLILAI